MLFDHLFDGYCCNSQQSGNEDCNMEYYLMSNSTQTSSNVSGSELQRKDKVGKSEGSQESLEEEANESLDEDNREKPDITEGQKSEKMATEIKESDEAAESEEGEGKSDIVEDELKESLQKIKTYLRKWKKKLTKEI